MVTVRGAPADAAREGRDVDEREALDRTAVPSALVETDDLSGCEVRALVLGGAGAGSGLFWGEQTSHSPSSRP